MAEFALTFINFGLFVDRPGGATVILGARFHNLTFRDPTGKSTFIEPGTEIVLTRAGVPAQQRTEMPNEFIVGDLGDLLGSTVSAPDDLLVAPVDRTIVNARVVLSGGSIEARPCTIEPWDKWPYTFPSGPHFATDTVTFHHTVEANDHYELRIDGTVIAELGPGATATFDNADDEDAPYEPFGSLREFCELCRVAGAGCLQGVTALEGFEEAILRRDHWLAHPATQRKLHAAGLVSNFQMFGFHRVCAHLQTTGAV